MFLYLYFVLIRKLNESTEASCNCLIFVWNLIKKKNIYGWPRTRLPKKCLCMSNIRYPTANKVLACLYLRVMLIFNARLELLLNQEYFLPNYVLSNADSIANFNMQVKEVIISFFILMEQGNATRQVGIS